MGYKIKLYISCLIGFYTLVGRAAPVSLGQAIQQDAACQSLQKKVIELSKKNRQHEIALEKAEGRLQDLDRLQFEKTATLQRRYDLLQKLVGAIQRLSRHGTNALAQTAQQPDELIRSTIVLRALLQVALENNLVLHSEVKNLRTIRQTIDDETQRRSQTLHLLQGQSKKIEALLEKRKMMLKKEIDRRRRITERVNRLAGEAQSIHDLIQRISAPRPQPKQPPRALKVLPADRGGAFEFLPVQGKILAKFGEQTDHNSDGAGVVFAARPGARVLAPLQGQVVFSGPFRRYQNIVILKHNDLYFTLLAGMNRVDVDGGQMVEAGEPLGVMQEDGPSVIYLELRKEGSTVNPMAWLPECVA